MLNAMSITNMNMWYSVWSMWNILNKTSNWSTGDCIFGAVAIILLILIIVFMFYYFE